MKLRLLVLILGSVCLGLVACKNNSPITTPSPPVVQPKPLLTPTPTRALIFPGEEPDQPESSEGAVVIHIPFVIYSQGEQSSTDVPECVNSIPFQIIKDESRILIEGQEPIDCHFVDTPQDTPITYHVVLGYDGTLNGELLPATPDKPSGWLDAFLLVDGVISQYYTNYPQEATNPCPEENPCMTKISEAIPLPFTYEEGSEITTPWTFLLHIPKSSE